MSAIHVWGFGDEERIVSGVKATVVDGTLWKIANSVIDQIRSHGHAVDVSVVRSLDGWLREVHLTVDVDGTRMWHRFVEPSEPWLTHDSRRPAAPQADFPASNTELHQCDSHEAQRANGGDGR